MEPWRKTWRAGALPLLLREDLLALKAALVNDDPRLEHGLTTTPPPVREAAGWAVENACLLAYVGACRLGGFARCAARDEHGVRPAYFEAATAGEVEEFFARTCLAIDDRLKEPAGCRWLLNWWDEGPRGKVRQEMLAEVRLALDTFQESGDG